jgi:hypothetical protein
MKTRFYILSLMTLLAGACGNQSSESTNNSKEGAPPTRLRSEEARLPATVTFSREAVPFETLQTELDTDPQGMGAQAWGTRNSQRNFSASILRYAETPDHKTLKLEISDLNSGASAIICSSHVPMQIARDAEYACSGPHDGANFQVSVKVLP